MARPERIEVSGISPLMWRAGWGLGLFIIASVIGMIAMIAAGIPKAMLPWCMVAFSAVVIAIAGAFAWPSKIVLGAESVAFTRYGRTRRVLYADIAKVDVLERLGTSIRSSSDGKATWSVFSAVRLTLEDGSKLDMGTGSADLNLDRRAQPLTIGAYGNFGGDSETSRLARHLRERVRDVKAAPEPAPLVARLMRGTQSIDEWRSALEMSGARSTAHVAYRVAEPVEQLWEVLEDEEAPADARAGAAVALRASLDDGGRARMRIVAENVASPRLRVAMEAASHDDADEEHITEALRQASLHHD